MHAAHRADCRAQHVPLGAGLGEIDGTGLGGLGRRGAVLTVLGFVGQRGTVLTVLGFVGPVALEALVACTGAARMARGGGVGVENKLEKKPPIKYRPVCFVFVLCFLVAGFFFPWV